MDFRTGVAVIKGYSYNSTCSGHLIADRRTHDRPIDSQLLVMQELEIHKKVNSLTISTCQAPDMEFICQDLAQYLSRRVSIPVVPKLDVTWQERDRLVDEGQIDICWICGLPYVQKVDRPATQIELLAAPVMQGERYQNRPIYYSDVIVHADSPFRSLADLRNATWTYNEPGSHSGYNVVLYELAVRGEGFGFFRRVIESGAHQNSLRMILDREVDASAIDSTVLELEISQDPSLRSKLRIIETFGPSPIPPWVISKRLPAEFRKTLRELLYHMDRDPGGRALLSRGQMIRFAAVDDRDYDPIRKMYRIAENVRLGRKPD